MIIFYIFNLLSLQFSSFFDKQSILKDTLDVSIREIRSSIGNLKRASLKYIFNFSKVFSSGVYAFHVNGFLIFYHIIMLMINGFETYR